MYKKLPTARSKDEFRLSSEKKKINFKYQHKEENKTEKSLKTTHDISQTGFYKPNAGKNHSNYDDDKNDDEKD